MENQPITWKDMLGRVIYKVTSAKWMMAVIFISGFVYAMVHSINLPDYAVMIGTLIVKSYFDYNHPAENIKGNE